MKRLAKLKKLILLSICLSFLLGASSCNKDKAGKEGKVSYISADFAVNTDNPYELVGFSDYYFVAEVISEKGTEYRDPVTIERESGVEEVAFPYTNYEIRPIRNIKGDLPLDQKILVTKAGGESKKGDLIIYEKDALLEVGDYYVITASVQSDGSLLISGPNSSIKLDERIEDSTNQELFEEYDEIYVNEVEYDRERFEYKNK